MRPILSVKFVKILKKTLKNNKKGLTPLFLCVNIQLPKGKKEERKEKNMKDLEDIPETKGRIEDTEEKCIMKSNGFWVGYKGTKITSYVRIDKPDNCQYSMDRHHRFWIETED